MSSKLTRLRPAHMADLVRAYVYLLLAGWQVFVRRERIDRWLTSSLSNAGHVQLDEHQRASIRRAVRWTNAAARYPFPWAKCLQRSLALCQWLERQGLSPDLRIGVRKQGGELLAHAWVEYRGYVINDTARVRERFVTLQADGARLPRFGW